MAIWNCGFKAKPHDLILKLLKVLAMWSEIVKKKLSTLHLKPLTLFPCSFAKATTNDMTKSVKLCIGE